LNVIKTELITLKEIAQDNWWPKWRKFNSNYQTRRRTNCPTPRWTVFSRFRQII